MSIDSESEHAQLVRMRTWDLPTRLAHWSLAALFGISWWTGEIRKLEWHRLSGYSALVLVLFRVYWGFFGSTTARFAGFLRGPRTLWSYALRLFERAPSYTFPGHNPMGGWSVIGMLGLLLLQAGTGLFAVDIDGLDSGPLAFLVSFERGRTIAGIHHVIFDFLLVLIALHVVMVVFYTFYKQQNIVQAMLGGYKLLPRGFEPTLHFASLWRAVLGLATAILLVAFIANGFAL